MPVTWTVESPWRTPERILTFGQQGTGKSYALMCLARACPTATFHVIDNDMSESYNRALDKSFPDVTNVIVYRCNQNDFMEMYKLLQRIAPQVAKGDWLVVDSMTVVWSAIQSWFIEQVHGKTEDEYFLEIREKKKKLNLDTSGAPLAPMEGWMDWPVINKRYNAFMNEIFQCKGHLYLTAESAPLGKDDDRETKDRFGPYAVKPAGQKRLGHATNTVLICKKPFPNQYQMVTVKDRDNVEMNGKPIGDFAFDYMVDIAGWKKRPVTDKSKLVKV